MIEKLKISLVLLVVLAISIIVIIKISNNNLSRKLANTEYNLTVVRDSIRIIKDKTGNTESDKLAYLADNVKNLALLNKDLSDKIKSIQGNISSIITTEVKIVEKPVPFLVTKKVKDSGLISIHFKQDTVYSPGNYKILSGYTEYNTYTGEVKAKKITDESGIALTTGIKNLDKGKPEIFIKSNYPGFSVTSLNGAVLDPKLFNNSKKNKTPLVTPGITIGWTPVTWNNDKQEVNFSTKSVGITAGLSFNVLKLLGFKK